MRAFRSDPHFADLFAHVPVICWPILWWQLNALLAWSRRQGGVDLLYSVNDWGFITLRHAGEAPRTANHKPLARTFRPLTDASWGSDLPLFAADLAAFETLRLVPILPCISGGGGILRSRMSEGALPSLPNTS